MAGLFDYQSPENMRAARLQPLLVSGAQMGQQPLLSQLVSQMSNAGANIGATGAGMLGMQLPEELAQQRVKDIMQGVDLNSPEGLMGAAKKLSDMGETKGAQALIEQSNKVKTSGFELGALQRNEDYRKEFAALGETPTLEQVTALDQKFGNIPEVRAALKDKAALEKVKKGIDGRATTLKKYMPIGTPPEVIEDLSSTANLPIFQDLMKEVVNPKNEFKEVDGKVNLYRKSDGTLIKELGKVTPKEGVNINMGDVFQKAYNQADAKKASEAWADEGTRYRTNANTLVRLKELRPELSKAYTGQFGEAKLVIAKSLQALGLPVDMGAITTTEQLKAATSQFVQAIAKTFPGSQSNKELDQLIASTPNILQIMPTIIKKMTEIERELVSQQATYRQMDNMPVEERAKANGNRMYVDNLKSTRRYYSLMDKQTSGTGVSKAEIAEAMKLQQELGVD